MSHSAPVSPPGRGAPLLVTAELPPEVLAWADALRRAHYPPDRNRLRAHVTLFHGIPPSAGPEVRDTLSEFARRAPPEARVSGIMDLGTGTAFAVESPGMVSIHAELADLFHGIIQQKDDRELRLHITIQNKVSSRETQALQDQLKDLALPGRFHFSGFGLYFWDGALWGLERVYPFRG